jgi:hypothetical protein
MLAAATTMLAVLLVDDDADVLWVKVRGALKDYR